MIKYYFTYGDIDSRDLGVKVISLPVDRPPGRKRNETDVFGIDGREIQFSNAYTSRRVEIPVRFIGTYNNENIRKISRIFSKTQEQLTFSWDDAYYYIATPENGEFEEIFNTHGTGVIEFLCKPFKYIKEGETFRPIIGNINNDYMETAPVLRFKGSGDITITLNGSVLIFKGLPETGGWIYADSLLQQIYTEEKDILSHHLDIQSDFPILKEGANSFTYSGTITEIEIRPNWREI